MSSSPVRGSSPFSPCQSSTSSDRQILDLPINYPESLYRRLFPLTREDVIQYALKELQLPDLDSPQRRSTFFKVDDAYSPIIQSLFYGPSKEGENLDEEEDYEGVALPGSWANVDGFMKNLEVLVQLKIIPSDHRFVRFQSLSSERERAGRPQRLPDIGILMGGIDIPPSRTMLRHCKENDERLEEQLAFCFELREQDMTAGRVVHRSGDQDLFPRAVDNLCLLTSQLVVRDYALSATIACDTKGTTAVRLWYGGSDGIVASDYNSKHLMIHYVRRLANFTEVDFGIRQSSATLTLDDDSYYCFIAPPTLPPLSRSSSLESLLSSPPGLDSESTPTSTTLSLKQVASPNYQLIGPRTVGFVAECPNYVPPDGQTKTLTGFVKISYHCDPRIDAEKEVLLALKDRPHPNLRVAYGSWRAREAIFPQYRWWERYQTVHLMEDLKGFWELKNLRQGEVKGIKEVVLGIITGLGYLRSLGYSHGDLTPDAISFRILPRSDGDQVVGILGDFDSAARTSKAFLGCHDHEHAVKKRQSLERQAPGASTFSSINILGQRPAESQGEYGEVESLFYIILWYLMRNGYEHNPGGHAQVIIDGWTQGGVTGELFKIALRSEGIRLYPIAESYKSYTCSLDAFLERMWELVYKKEERFLDHGELVEQLKVMM